MGKTKMTYKSVVENILLLLLFVLGANLFVFLKTAGLETFFLDESSRPFSMSEAILKTSIGGFKMGLSIILFEIYLYPKIPKRWPLWTKRGIWVLSISTLLVFHVFTTQISYDVNIEKKSWAVSWESGIAFLNSGVFYSFFVYFMIISMAVRFLRQLRLNFGEAIFFNYLSGKYATPFEVERTFMFIDLNNSTFIAENLGHQKYSRFLNKAFDDILEALQGFEFDIYQFVGDEIVLTWLAKDNAKNNVLKMQQSITDKHVSLTDFYQGTFGTVPAFKSAVNTGKVIATLIGRGQKEFAYHGDVLNTAARVLQFCKKYNKSILVTEDYLDAYPDNHSAFTPKLLDSVQLRGKQSFSQIFAID